MDRRAWQATVYGVTRVRHDRATKCTHTGVGLKWVGSHFYNVSNQD